MIFVTVGSQKFQFNRLLQYMDSLVKEHLIQEQIFAQTGFSDYQPQNYAYKDFLDRDEFIQKMLESEIVITHGGTGTIMGAVKAGKRVIAVPRLSRYGEHVDDHQEQIIKLLMDEHIIMGVDQLENIEDAINKRDSFSMVPYISNTKAIIENIDNYVLELSKDR